MVISDVGYIITHKSPICQNSNVDLPVAKGIFDELLIPGITLRNANICGLILIVVLQSVCDECSFFWSQKGSGFWVVVEQKVCCHGHDYGDQAFEDESGCLSAESL